MFNLPWPPIIKPPDPEVRETTQEVTPKTFPETEPVPTWESGNFRSCYICDSAFGPGGPPALQVSCGQAAVLTLCYWCHQKFCR